MPPPLPFNPYTCDPCLGDPRCEDVVLEDMKVYKRFIMRTLCAIKALLGGGGPAGYATEATLQAVNAKITTCDTSNVTVISMPAVTLSSGSVTVNNAAGASAVNVQDGGNSLTVDGSVSVSSLPAVTGAVSVNNAAGASAVNIQDGGNSITVDGSVGVSGSVTVSNAAGASAVNIQDGGNSITVDGSVGVSSLPAVTGTVTSNIYGFNQSNFQPANLDTISRSLMALDWEHHEIHEGNHFIASHFATGKNAGQTINIYVKTPNTTKWCHFLAEWASDGAAYFRVYEAPTVTANTGTNGQTPYNNNRNSATVSDVIDNAAVPASGKYGYDVTVTGTGTTLYTEFSGIGKTESGKSRATSEIILKQNTVYVFEVTSNAANEVLSLNMAWYEHTSFAA